VELSIDERPIEELPVDELPIEPVLPLLGDDASGDPF
jgi:hypothetical protein